MNKSKKIWVLLMVCFTLLVAGCSSKSSTGGNATNIGNKEGSSNEQVTITFMHLWPEDLSAGQNKIVNEIIDEYQKEHVNITIKTEVLDNEQYKNKLKVLSTANKLPDVGVTWATGFMQPYVEGELFAPIDDLLTGTLSGEFVAGTTEAYSMNGHTYALPLEFNIAPIYYNKALFEQFKVEVPTTYDEFQYIVKVLRENGIAPIALGNKDRWTGSLWYMYLADRIAGQAVLSNAIHGTEPFTNPDLVEAAAAVQQLVDENAFNKGFNGLSNDEGKAEFINEKAAMYLIGTWELPNFTTNEDVPQEFKDKVGFFKFPTVENGKGNIDSWVGGPGVGLFVSENSKVKEEAKGFIEYFVEKWGERSVVGAGVMPATKVDTDALDLPALYIDLFKEINKASSITLFVDVEMPADAAEVHLNQIQALFGKAVTPEKFSEVHDAAISAGR